MVEKKTNQNPNEADKAEKKPDTTVTPQPKSLKAALADMNKAQERINAANTKKTVKVEGNISKETVKVQIEKSKKARTNAQDVHNNISDPESLIVEKMRRFMDETGSKLVYNAGTPDEHVHALAPAWDYLAKIMQCHVEVDSLWETNHAFDSRVRVVHCRANLVEDNSGKILTKVECVAESNEAFLEHQPLNACYGLATTRAKCRAVQTVFSSYMAMAKVSVTPAEEIYNDKIDIEAI